MGRLAGNNGRIWESEALFMEFTYDVTMFQDTFEHEFTYLNGFLRNVSKTETNRPWYVP